MKFKFNDIDIDVIIMEAKNVEIKNVPATNIKLFNRWDMNVKVNDSSLEKYISLEPKILPKSFGRMRQQFHKSYMNIVERLIMHLMVPGHRGKKHLLTSGRTGGKWQTAYALVKQAFEIVEQKTKKNPIEVFVRALENSAWREEITSFQVGGIMVRKAVITSPQRRVDAALRLMAQGSYQKAFGNKGFAQCLAEEIIAAYNYDMQNSLAIREKERIEREAAGAR